jgi:F420-dependent oxidoreductase-like protein
MAQIGIMIEGQDGTTWARWERILKAAEDFGYQCVFRSDHYTNAGPPDKDSLELWVSFTYAATYTRRIEFGPLVCPPTFRHPAMTVRMAAAVDDLSGGRLVLGLGAGWNEYEHRKFGVPFYNFPTRYEMLTDALEISMRLLMSDGPVSYQGKLFSLDDAILLPRPKRPGGPPILIGGKGPKRTLPLVAKYADEWNVPYLPVEDYKERAARLNELVGQYGREPGDLKHSLMAYALFARSEAELSAKMSTRGDTPESLRARGALFGTAAMMVDQIGQYVEAGVERFMLQWLDQDDIEGLELIARDVLPAFHK